MELGIFILFVVASPGGAWDVGILELFERHHSKLTDILGNRNGYCHHYFSQQARRRKRKARYKIIRENREIVSKINN